MEAIYNKEAMRIFEIVDGEINRIGLVKIPAITRYFTMVGDRVIAPVIIPYQLIYRRDEGSDEEYFVKWSYDSVKNIIMKHNYTCGSWFNLMHDDKAIIDDDIGILGYFISDKDLGIYPPGGYSDLPDGTLFIDIIVRSEELSKLIKIGGINGFSVEGNFEMIEKYEMI